jgi:beta-glucosidase
VLFGDVNPSGKLPCTFPKRLGDSPAHALGAYPGRNGKEVYAEGLLVGYRWFDTKKVEPLFPFGYGLSYTKFEYSNLKLVDGTGASGPALAVQFDVANTGAREGAEVAEVYVRDAEASLPRPDKELKGFQKVLLKPGEKRTVTVPLDRRAFAYYDPQKGGWVAEAGDFSILVGASSRDIRLDGVYRLAQTTVEK